MTSGFVAILSRSAVDDEVREDLATLLGHFEAVAGPTGPVQTVSSSHAVAAGIGRASVRHDADGWTIWAGAPIVEFRGHGEAALAGSDGQFGAVSHDARSGAVVVGVDHLGMASVVLAEADGRIYASTSALALARHLRSRPSRPAIAAFLRTGYLCGDATLWTDISRLEPGAAVTASGGQVRRTTWWRPEVDDGIRRLPLDAAVDVAIERTVAQLRRLPPEFMNGYADLTGGFDSRLLAVLLRAAGATPTFTTRSSPDGVDMTLAERLSRVEGWPWLPTPLPEDWPEKGAQLTRSALAAGDGRLEVLQLSRVLWAHQSLAGGDHATLMSAGGGEHFQFYAWQSELLAAGRRRTVNLDRWIMTIGMKPIDESLLAPQTSALAREHLDAQFRRWLLPWKGALNTTQLDVLYAYKSTGHFGAYRNSDDFALPALLPFYLKDVFLTAFSVDPRHRNAHRLMRRMVTRLNPRVAALPTTRGGPALPVRPRDAHRHLPYLGVLGRKGADKIAQRVVGRRLFARSARFEWEPAANAVVLSRLQEERLVDWARLAVAPLLATDALDRLRHASRHAGFGATDVLGRVLTVELALRAAGSDDVG